MEDILKALIELEKKDNYFIQNQGTIFENKVKKFVVDITTKDNRYLTPMEALKEMHNLKLIMLKNQLSGKKVVYKINDIKNLNIINNGIEIILNNGEIEKLTN